MDNDPLMHKENLSNPRFAIFKSKSIPLRPKYSASKVKSMILSYFKENSKTFMRILSKFN